MPIERINTNHGSNREARRMWSLVAEGFAIEGKHGSSDSIVAFKGPEPTRVPVTTEHFSLNGTPYTAYVPSAADYVAITGRRWK